MSCLLSFLRLSAGVVGQQPQGALREHKDNESGVQRGYFTHTEQLRQDVETALRTLTPNLVCEFVPLFLDGNVLNWDDTLHELRKRGDYVCLRLQNERNDLFCSEVEKALSDVVMMFRNPQGNNSLVENMLRRSRDFTEPYLAGFLEKHPDQSMRLAASSSLQSSAPTSHSTPTPSEYANAWIQIILSAKEEINSSTSASGSAAARLSALVVQLAQKWLELKKAMEKRRQKHASMEQKGPSAQPPVDGSNSTVDMITLAASMLKLNY